VAEADGTKSSLGLDRKIVWRWSRGQGRPTADDLERLLAVARQWHDEVAKAYLPALEHVNAYIRAQRTPQGTSHLLPGATKLSVAAEIQYNTGHDLISGSANERRSMRRNG
jgi:hypothetical protein